MNYKFDVSPMIAVSHSELPGYTFDVELCSAHDNALAIFEDFITAIEDCEGSEEDGNIIDFLKSVEEGYIDEDGIDAYMASEFADEWLIDECTGDDSLHNIIRFCEVWNEQNMDDIEILTSVLGWDTALEIAADGDYAIFNNKGAAVEHYLEMFVDHDFFRYYGRYIDADAVWRDMEFYYEDREGGQVVYTYGR